MDLMDSFIHDNDLDSHQGEHVGNTREHHKWRYIKV
jgi:hypothetical protein